jgi:precorrin-6B methylase 2
MNISDATLQFVADHAADDVRALALKGAPNADVDLPFALDQIRGRQMARHKLPSWASCEGLVYPRHLSMEQCSSEPSGLYKREVVARILAQKSSIPSSNPSQCDSATPTLTLQPDGAGDRPSEGGGFSTGAPYSSSSDSEASSASVEVSSQDEQVAFSSAKRLTGKFSLVDLTGGFGVDFAFLAPLFKEAVYVEQQPELCDIARHNFPLLGLHGVRVVCGDGVTFLKSMPFVNVIFMDPARRDEHGSRTYGISDCTPNVLDLLPLLLDKSAYLLLKLSPMLDVSKAVQVFNHVAGQSVVSEVHVVSVGNECKELLMVVQRAPSIPMLYCVNGSQRWTCQLSGSTSSRYPLLHRWPSAGEYLFEPNASLMKAGCFASLCQRFGVVGVGANSHLFVGPNDLPDFPGRRFRIVSITTLGKQNIKNLLADVQAANITVRNFPLSAVQLRKRLKLQDGGDVYLFATTLANKQHVVIKCYKSDT